MLGLNKFKNLKNIINTGKIVEIGKKINKNITKHSRSITFSVLAILGAHQANANECVKKGVLNENISSGIVRDSGLSYDSNIIGYITRDNIDNIIFDWNDKNNIEVKKGIEISGIGIELNGKKGYISENIVSKISDCDFNEEIEKDNKSEIKVESNNLEKNENGDNKKIEYFKSQNDKNIELTLKFSKLENNTELEKKLILTKKLIEDIGNIEKIEIFLKDFLPKIGYEYEGSIISGTDNIFTFLRKSSQNGEDINIKSLMFPNYIEYKNFSKENINRYINISQTEYYGIYSKINNPSNWTVKQIRDIEKEMLDEINNIINSLRNNNLKKEQVELYDNNNIWILFHEIGSKYYEKIDQKLTNERIWMGKIINNIINNTIEKFKDTIEFDSNFNFASEKTLYEYNNTIEKLGNLLSLRGKKLLDIFQTKDFLIELNIVGTSTSSDKIEKDFEKILNIILKSHKDRIFFLLEIDKNEKIKQEKLKREKDVTNYQLQKYGEINFTSKLGQAIKNISTDNEKLKNDIINELIEITQEFLKSDNFSQFIRDFNKKYGTNISFELKKNNINDTFYSYYFYKLLNQYINYRQDQINKEYINKVDKSINTSLIDIDNILEKNKGFKKIYKNIELTLNRAKKYDLFINDKVTNSLRYELEEIFKKGILSGKPDKYFNILGEELSEKYKISKDFLIQKNLNTAKYFDNIATILRIKYMRVAFSNLENTDYQKVKRRYGQLRIFNTLAINDNISEFQNNLNKEYDKIIKEIYNNHPNKKLIDDFFNNKYEEYSHYIYRHLGIESRGRVWIRSGISDRRGEYAVGPIQQKMQFARQFGGNPFSKRSIENIINHMLYSFYGIESIAGKGKGEGQLSEYKEHPLKFDIGLASHIAWDRSVYLALKEAEKKGNIESFYKYLPTREMQTFIERADSTLTFLEENKQYFKN